MKNIDHVPDDEKQHFMKCPVCHEYFDMRDLGQAFQNFHDAVPNPRNISPLRKVNPEWGNSARLGSPEEFLNGKIRVNRN